jgi:hypothetical protein
MPIIPALGKLRQEDHELQASLGYLVRPCLKTKTNPHTTATANPVFSIIKRKCILIPQKE